MTEKPRDPLEHLQREVERLFRDLVYRRHPASHFADPVWSPPADLVVSKLDARVLVELAGVPRDSIQVHLRGRLLEVQFKDGMLSIHLKRAPASAATEIKIEEPRGGRAGRTPEKSR